MSPRIALLSADVVESLCGDLLTGRRLRPPSPPAPGYEDESPALWWLPVDHDSGNFAWTAYVPLDPGTDVDALRRIQPQPEPPGNIGVSFARTDIGADGIDGLRRGPARIGEYPEALVVPTDRLDALGAIAVQPQNMPQTRVHLRGLTIHCVGPSYPVTLEIATRLAEYIVEHDIG